MNILDEEMHIMKLMMQKHGVVYYELFGRLMLDDGMDIRTAIWECWNQLECGGKNG